MKHFLLGLLLLLLQNATGQELEVLVWNIRYAGSQDGPDQWELRRDELISYMAGRKPAIIGLQEVLHGQLQDILNVMDHYQFTGVGRDDGKNKGEFSPILFDTTQIKMLQSGSFWLSETHDTVSVGWDALLPRICTYGLFTSKENGQNFWFFNTHFDHIGEEARMASAKLIQQRITAINSNDLPVLLAGDLNSEPQDENVLWLQKRWHDAFLKNPAERVFPEGTYCTFDPEYNPKKRIDYIFYKNLELKSFEHLTQKRSNGRWLSDHLAIWAGFTF
jgi:endonuclease/exonuclease/phosphatase family metal-dependent hydrolase